MARKSLQQFKPCARVRILRSNGWPYLAGQEATIVEEVPFEDVKNTNDSTHRYWLLRVDCWGGTFSPTEEEDGVNQLAAPESNLATLTRDGYQIVEWSECLWHPKQKRSRKKRIRDAEEVRR